LKLHSSNPIRLTSVITGLPAGGAESMLLKLMSRLPKSIERRVISLTTMGDLGEQFQAMGIPVDAMNMRPGVVVAAEVVRLARQLATHRPDIVHTWLYHADALGGIAARLAGVQRVAWNIRTSDLPASGVKWSTRFAVRVCAGLSRWIPDRIACCSEAAMRIHIALGYPAQKLVLLPNGFDTTRFQPDAVARDSVRAELEVPSDAKLVGMVARFDPQKDHASFVQAARLVHARLPDVCFLLVGTGVDWGNDTLTAAIDHAGVRRVVHLMGMRLDIPRLMAALDVAVLSSCWGEAFPNVVGEAMACAVPCVVTDVGDSASIVGETGLVVSPRDPEQLAQAIERLLRMPDAERSQLGLKARERVQEHFALDAIALRYEAFYRSLLGRERDRF
jgi:glycosyltransferase involved in cell wall biosynthesis